MTSDIALEHIRSGTDCIAEALQNIRRVQKNFPATVAYLAEAEQHLKTARSLLQKLDAIEKSLSVVKI